MSGVNTATATLLVMTAGVVCQDVDVCGAGGGHICDLSRVSLQSNYSKERRPAAHPAERMRLNASIYLKDILEVAEFKQQLRFAIYGLIHLQFHNISNSLEVVVRFYWKDPRIIPNVEHMRGHDNLGSYVNLVGSCWKERIWMPDIYILHTIKIREPSYIFEPSSLR